MPVMEGKAMLFKEFGGVDAWPICLATKEADEIVAAVTAIAPGFGGINLEDISAPRCFEIESRLQGALDIPVFHDDQHGTAVVVLAALPERARRRRQAARGRARRGHRRRRGRGRDDRHAPRRGRARHHRLRPAGRDPPRARRTWRRAKAAFAERTNPSGFAGTADEALAGADVFIGLSGPGAVTRDGDRVDGGRRDRLRDGEPDARSGAGGDRGPRAVVATGRSDYPNQINNVLAFPGIFRGALDVRASAINEEMELAAAEAIAAVVKPDELAADYMIPSVFNRDVAPPSPRRWPRGRGERRRAPPSRCTDGLSTDEAGSPRPRSYGRDSCWLYGLPTEERDPRQRDRGTPACRRPALMRSVLRVVDEDRSGASVLSWLRIAVLLRRR